MVTSERIAYFAQVFAVLAKPAVLWQSQRAMSAPGQETLLVGEVTKRLSQIVESLSATANPVERAYLLKEFRLLLDIADNVIFREFPEQLNREQRRLG